MNADVMQSRSETLEIGQAYFKNIYPSYVSFRYIDWTGKKTQKLKRGFKTKKESLNYEKEFIRKTAEMCIRDRK